MTQPQTLFSVTNLSKSFGGLTAINNVSLEIKQGEICGLIGPNGAGKTTFFNLMTGLYSADQGQFSFEGKTFKPSAPHKVAEMGIARTFQNIRLFPTMTAVENVLVGMHCRLNQSVMGSILRTSAQRKEEVAARDKALALLDYVGIAKYADETSKHLSYGDQRRLEIARALATEPKLLALDEPAAGMNATEKQKLRELLKQLQKDHKTVLLIEHDVKLIMGICDQVTVLDYGEVIEQGTPNKVQRSKAVIEAYLGGLHHG